MIIRFISDLYVFIGILYFLFLNIFYIFLVFQSLLKLISVLNISNIDIIPLSSVDEGISILVPSYNEEETIVESVRSLLRIDYPNFEVIVINDGSQDKTLEFLIIEFKLRKVEYDFEKKIACNDVNDVYLSLVHSNLIVINKLNGGKSDSLNAGINISKYPLVCTIDADCIIEKNALTKIAKPFVKYKDTIAVGGIVRIVNSCKVENSEVTKVKVPKNIWAKFQVLEYFRAFLIGRIGWDNINSLLIISGAFGLFNKNAIIEIGGYKKTIGEDMELVLNLHEKSLEKNINYKIRFASDAVCWTQVPENIASLKSQRVRWHKGLIDSLSTHKKMFLNPRYGIVGVLGMFYYWVFEIVGPVIEFLGYIQILITIITNNYSILLIQLYIISILTGIFFTLISILFEEFSYKKYFGVKEVTKLILCSILEHFCFRQLTVYWRLIAVLTFKKENKIWGKIKRKKF